MSASRSPREEPVWRPAASLERLRRRAAILEWIRAFFRGRDVLEVETPLLCAAGSIDLHLEPIPARCRAAGRRAMYLMTSPECSMKRLLAAGSGPIYQITRAFRDGERGPLHNLEFTILEWYRPGQDHLALMDEVEALVDGLLQAFGAAGSSMRPFARITYRDAFRSALGIDPHTASIPELESIARREGVAPPPQEPPPTSRDDDRDTWLDLLLATRVQPMLGLDRPTFVTDYPASQAASARLLQGDPPAVAERFELYARGLELANGYRELPDPRQQERRFKQANRARQSMGRRRLPIDHRLLAALRAGLPDSSGVAMGLDRLVMLALGATQIDDVIAFPLERA